MRVLKTLILFLVAKSIAASLMLFGVMYLAWVGAQTITVMALTAFWTVVVISFVAALYTKALWMVWFRQPTTAGCERVALNTSG